MNFVAIDVETANADMASICQIGVAKKVEGELTEEWSSLVDPEDYFDFLNIDDSTEKTTGQGTSEFHLSSKRRFLNIIRSNSSPED